MEMARRNCINFKAMVGKWWASTRSLEETLKTDIILLSYIVLEDSASDILDKIVY